MFHRTRHQVASGVSTLVLLTALAGLAVAADAPRGKAKAYSDPRQLHVSPGSAPRPALRYRLLPLEPERTPGDAAPIYIRLGVKATPEAKQELMQKSTDWANLPLDQLPVADARKFIDQWTKTLEQLRFGAWRQSCDWNYPLREQKEQVIEVVMPDLQDMRNWARLQALKARVEIAQHLHDDAIRTIETGISAARHTGDGPFVINTLVGMASAQVMLGCVEELIAQPGAPNLYWALTALPRPLVGLRHAQENEQMQPHWLFPELDAVDRPHTETEWAALLARLHTRMKEIEQKIVVTDGTGTHPAKTTLTDLATFKARTLPAARAYAQGRRGAIDGLPEDQIILLYLADRVRELYDDQFKYAYLPYPDAVAASAGSEARLKALEGGPLDVFAALMTSVVAALRVEARLDRTVAALRVIEALRMHIADRGELPGSLDQVTIVPIPLDPMTAKPFAYRREGETVILIGPDPTPQTVLTYRITLRK